MALRNDARLRVVRCGEPVTLVHFPQDLNNHWSVSVWLVTVITPH